MYTYHSKAGYSLVETLVSIAILMIAFVGPLTIAVKSLQVSYFIREQTTATFLAQEGLEAIISMRNDALLAALANDPNNLAPAWDWVDDRNLAPCFNGNGCNIDYEEDKPYATRTVHDCDFDSCLLYKDANFGSPGIRGPYVLSSVGNEPTPYTRIITLDKDTDTDVVYITSTVEWNARVFSTGDSSVTLQTAVYNIYGN